VGEEGRRRRVGGRLPRSGLGQPGVGNDGVKLFEQLSGVKLFEQLSGVKLFEQLSGVKLFEQLSGVKLFEQLSADKHEQVLLRQIQPRRRGHHHRTGHSGPREGVGETRKARNSDAHSRNSSHALTI